jgi:hypothetical protein
MERSSEFMFRLHYPTERYMVTITQGDQRALETLLTLLPTANTFSQPVIEPGHLTRSAPVYKLWLNLDLPLFLYPFEYQTPKKRLWYAPNFAAKQAFVTSWVSHSKGWNYMPLIACAVGESRKLTDVKKGKCVLRHFRRIVCRKGRTSCREQL